MKRKDLTVGTDYAYTNRPRAGDIAAVGASRVTLLDKGWWYTPAYVPGGFATEPPLEVLPDGTTVRTHAYNSGSGTPGAGVLVRDERGHVWDCPPSMLRYPWAEHADRSRRQRQQDQARIDAYMRARREADQARKDLLDRFPEILTRRHLTGDGPADFSFTTGDLAGLLADLGVER